MKYVLGIGYDCKKYKQNPLCRVFVNDQLIDEFHIIIRKNKRTNKWQKFPAYKTYIPNLWKKIHFYHIDENVFTKDINDIRIEIQNADSNYTNGFMTKSTLVLISPFLCPAEFITRKGIEKIHNLQKRRILNPLNRLSARGLNKSFTNRPKIFMDSNGEEVITSHLDIYKHGDCSEYIFDWPSKPPHTWNGKMLPYGGPGIRFHGGSGTLRYKVVKKLGIWLFAHPKVRPVGFPIIDRPWARTIAQLVGYDWKDLDEFEYLQYYSKGDSNKYIDLLKNILKSESWISDTGEIIEKYGTHTSETVKNENS